MAIQAVWSAHRHRKVKARVRIGLQLLSQLDLVFPGFGDCFEDVIRAKGGHVILPPESEAQNEKAILVIQDLVGYYREHLHEVPDTFTVPDAEPLTRAIDYVAGMTDRFASTPTTACSGRRCRIRGAKPCDGCGGA